MTASSSIVQPMMMAVSSAAMLEVYEQRSTDAGAILADAGLTRASFREPGARIPSAAGAALWRAAYERSGDAALALRAAQRVPFGAYRVLDYLQAAAPTIGDAFEQLGDHFSLINPTVTLAIAPCNDGIWLRVDAGEALPAAYVEYTLAAIYGRTRAATRGRFSPLTVEVGFAPPATTAEHARTFRCPVTFRAATSGMLLAHEVWDTPNPAGDAGLFAVLCEHARGLRAQGPASHARLLADVRAAIGAQLALGERSLSVVARQLAMSARSLQRRLAQHGTRYADLLDDARSRAARAYLREPHRSVAEVASLVGFTQHSSFTRAFLRWTGCTPSAFRSAHAGRRG